MFKIRQALVFFFLAWSFLILSSRLFYLQVINFPRFAELASLQHNDALEIEAQRGGIFDSFMETCAGNLYTPSIYCNPRQITSKELVARRISEVLDIKYESILAKLGRNKGFAWIKRKVDSETMEKVKKLKLAGVYFLDANKRFYPSDNMASHIIGFVDIDNNGLEGIELMYDKKLKGTSGWKHLLRDAKQKTVLVDEKESIPPRTGLNLILTIDSVIQCIVEEELEAMVKKFNARSASIIAMDPFSGKILALANYPNYSLNEVTGTSPETIKNIAISSVYEPGSAFKVVTASAVLNEKAIDLETPVFCENGEYYIGGRVLHDYHGYGRLTFREVIAKSSNIGTVKSSQRIGKDVLYKYIRMFGFGELTDIDLPGEIKGIVRNPKEWAKSDMTTIPIGQGIAITPIQLVCAISVIANGGYLMKPYIVDRITTSENEVYMKYKPIIKRKVLDTRTTIEMKDTLHHVTTHGTGKSALSKLYNVCGKTGTSQMPNPNGGYYTDRYSATFIGFAPKEKPLVSMVIVAHDPHPLHFGGTVAAPTFKKIVERVVQYLNSNVGIIP